MFKTNPGSRGRDTAGAVPYVKTESLTQQGPNLQREAGHYSVTPCKALADSNRKQASIVVQQLREKNSFRLPPANE